MAILVAPTGGVRAHQWSRSLRPVQSASFPSGDRLVGPSTTGRTWTTLCPRTRPDVVGASVQRGAMQPPDLPEALQLASRRGYRREPDAATTACSFSEREPSPYMYVPCRAKRSSVERVMLDQLCTLTFPISKETLCA
jgi:hypothetical protein